MSKIIDRTGKGAALDQGEFDGNYDSLHGINQVIAGATHTVDITDQGDTLEFTNAGAVAVTLDSIATIQGAAHTSDFHVTLIATNAATVATITPNVANSFNTGVATIVLAVDEYVTLETDSTGLVWNIINSSDSLKVGGLSASQFLRSDANDTTTGNLTIDKASPQFSIQCADEATEDTVIIFRDELSNIRAVAYRPNGTDKLVLDARTAVGAVQAAMDITEAGKVNVAVGIFQLAGVDVTSTAAELNILDGVTSTAAELNILDGVTSTAAELNIMDGDTVQATVTLAGTDGVVVDDAGIMKQCLVSDFPVYARSVTETLTNKTLISPVINTGVSGTALETTITNTDTKVPTSGAVFDKVAGLNTKVIDIGDWNMDTTISVTVAHNLTLSDIRDISVLIRNDAASASYPLNYLGISGEAGRFNLDATNVNLTRIPSEFFDNTSFDSITYNRGWIVIKYID